LQATLVDYTLAPGLTIAAVASASASKSAIEEFRCELSHQQIDSQFKQFLLRASTTFRICRFTPGCFYDGETCDVFNTIKPQAGMK